MPKVWVIISCSGNRESICRELISEMAFVDLYPIACRSLYAEKSWGMCAFLLSFPANFPLMNNEILMMSKLWPGKSHKMSDLPSK